MAPRPVGSSRRCFPVPAQGREPLLLPSSHMHTSAAQGSTSPAGDGDPHRPRLAGCLEAGPRPAPPRSPPPASDRLHQEHRLDPPPLESDLFSDLRVVLEAIGRPEGFIDSILRCQKPKTYSTQWSHYKSWCLDMCLHPWVSSDPRQVSLQSAHDQLINFLSHIKPNMQLFSDFCNHKSAICTALQ